MANLLLDYAIPFSQVTALPPPSFGFLHRIAVIVPMDEAGAEADIITVTDRAELEALTQYHAELAGFFVGGGAIMYLIRISAPEDLQPLIDGKESEFYTLFAHVSTHGILPPSVVWTGVRATHSDSPAVMALAGNEKTCVFADDADNSAYNALLAFGSLLSGAAWRNQQYISTTSSQGVVTTLGEAELLFDDRVSFYLADEEYGNRLALFAAGGQSITTPYISKELEMTVQFQMTNAITAAQPFNTLVQRKNLERIGMKVIGEYMAMGYLDPEMPQTLTVSDSQEAFVVYGKLITSPAVALWRARIDAFQTQG